MHIALGVWVSTAPLFYQAGPAEMGHGSLHPVDQPVDVIVPVYRGLASTQACLESVLSAQAQAPFSLVLIDDATPEPELARLLNRVAGDDLRVTLLRNAQNLGFVRSVNLGMAVHPDRDVVLLNSDTQVHGDWLDRLLAALRHEPQVGTATPLSNNATICSYPRFAKENALPRPMTAADLDALLARVNRHQRVDLPTAHGFCMAIRRDCLNATGLFDADCFGAGYGEENDFCARATQQGWRHVLAADTFVFHEGEVSFQSTGSARREAAYKKLVARHRHYPALIARHLQEDPARPLRLRADLARFLADPRPRVLFVNHDLGGGTHRHSQELADYLRDQALFFVLQPGPGESLVIRAGSPQEAFELSFQAVEERQSLLRLLNSLGLSRIHFHHWLGLPPWVLTLPEELHLPYDVTLHDYYAICPQVTLTIAAGHYCEEPQAASACNACLARRPVAEARDITSWRSRHAHWLQAADRVFAPSQTAAAKISRYVRERQVLVVPHLDTPENGVWPQATLPAIHSNAPLKIVVLGALNRAKGAELLDACAKDAGRRNLPLEFHLLGVPYRRLKTRRSKLVLHGRYNDADLQRTLEELAPHLAWFPALWPETYSYTASAAFAARLPVASTDLGAIAERVAGRAYSWTLPWQTSPVDWNNALVAWRAQMLQTASAAACGDGLHACSAGTPQTACERGQPQDPAFCYARDYLPRVENRPTQTDCSHMHHPEALQNAAQHVLDTFTLEELTRWAYPRIPLAQRAKDRVAEVLRSTPSWPLVGPLASLVPDSVKRRLKLALTNSRPG